jgi:O-antigen ligase
MRGCGALEERMADTVNEGRIGRVFDRAGLERLADWLAVAVVVTMPWFQSVFQILIVLWLLALIPTLDVASVRRELQSPAGLLPVLLWLLGLVGMLWADVPWTERVAGLGGFHKLLVIPLLLAHFRRSERGSLALYGFLLSCGVLLAVSCVGWMIGHNAYGRGPGLFVRDYIAQSSEFLVCIFALLGYAFESWRKGRVPYAAGAALLALLFLANILLVATGRTALVVMPLLLLVLGFRLRGWRGLVAAFVAAAVIAAVAWTVSPFLRMRVESTLADMRGYQNASGPGQTEVRIEMWRKAFGFLAAAPVVGHGTGSTQAQYRGVATGAGATAIVADNPHNQILVVAIQLGTLGVAVLMAMWVAHLAMFRDDGLVPWIGVVIVLQNVGSSLFNSHLFDSFHGWLYVFGFGVVGGMALRAKVAARADSR